MKKLTRENVLKALATSRVPMGLVDAIVSAANDNNFEPFGHFVEEVKTKVEVSEAEAGPTDSGSSDDGRESGGGMMF